MTSSTVSKPLVCLSGLVCCALVLSACASLSPTNVSDGQASNQNDVVSVHDSRADRAAILAMAGDFEVDFSFRETVRLAPDYQHHDPHNSQAIETVVVVTNQPGRIVLQHLLQSPSGHVTKHWRQDWVYEAQSRFEYVGGQRWEVREMPDATGSGAWTQCVFEVNDAPRYCGTGRWNHRYGVSTWTSDRTWRPLPRREHTSRDDYNALNVRNRHTIVPDGWTHEQDNTKVVLSDGQWQQTLAREVGFNEYRRTESVDFSPAQDYWQATAAYWRTVRAHWDRAFDSGCVHVQGGVSGMPMIIALFSEASELIAEQRDYRSGRIEEAFEEFVRMGDACRRT